MIDDQLCLTREPIEQLISVKLFAPCVPPVTLSGLILFFPEKRGGLQSSRPKVHTACFVSPYHHCVKTRFITQLSRLFCLIIAYRTRYITHTLKISVDMTLVSGEMTLGRLDSIDWLPERKVGLFPE